MVEEIGKMKVWDNKQNLQTLVKLKKKRIIRSEKWDITKMRKISSYETALKKICQQFY